jgi:redox-sensitive bicupin YhaK (pirin superfamily)
MGSTSPDLELIPAKAAEVGGLPVRRLLPRRPHRTIGAWCFADHYGPADATMGVGPHPHIGIHTVTWLLEGEVVHHDSLGSEQLIRPGQLNLMTAGHGVAHAEESTSHGSMHGIQLWVAQPETTRHGPPAFAHLPSLPRVEPGSGVVATVLLGEMAGATSPARTDTSLLGADLTVRGTGAVPLEPAFEHGLIVLEGSITVDGHEIGPGTLAYLGLGRDELGLTTGSSARVLLIGGEPFEAPILMSWNFVARTSAELDEAYRDWTAGADRFRPVDSTLPRIAAPGRV